MNKNIAWFHALIFAAVAVILVNAGDQIKSHPDSSVNIFFKLAAISCAISIITLGVGFYPAFRNEKLLSVRAEHDKITDALFYYDGVPLKYIEEKTVRLINGRSIKSGIIANKIDSCNFYNWVGNYTSIISMLIAVILFVIGVCKL